jgi:hypothetical protein
MSVLIIPSKVSVLSICLSLMFTSFASTYASQSTDKDSGPIPVLYGYVCGASLAAFAPDSASIPLHQLRSRQFDTVYGPLLEQYKEHPDSLAIIAGLLQASLGEPSPNFLDKTLQELGPESEQRMSEPERFRLATALDYKFSSGWPHPDDSLLHRSRKILSELWQTYHDPMEGFMLAESGWGAGHMNGPEIHVDVTEIQERIICSLLTPAAADRFIAASKNDWEGSAPSLDEAPVENRVRLMCAVQSMYSQNSGIFRTGKMVDGEIEWTQVPYTPEEIAIQNYLMPWLVALGAATGLKPALEP